MGHKTSRAERDADTTEAARTLAALRVGTEPAKPATKLSLPADVLGEIAACGDHATLAAFAAVSKRLAEVVDGRAAARCREKWETSAAVEARVRLGAGFLARRSQKILTTADGSSRIPLASRPRVPTRTGIVFERTRPAMGDRFLVIDVNVATLDGVVVANRSVIMDGPPTSDPRYFSTPLVVAEDLEPWFAPHLTWFSGAADQRENAWALEFSNVVGSFHIIDREDTSYPDGAQVELMPCSPIQRDLPEQMLRHGHVAAFRPSQLKSRRRVVSVRVDLFRGDGRSMCLHDEEVAFTVTSAHFGGESDDDDEPRGKLVGEEPWDIRTSLLPRSEAGDYETLHCVPTVLVEYPEGTAPAPFRLVAVKLQFSVETAKPKDEDHLRSLHRVPGVSQKAVAALCALDNWS